MGRRARQRLRLRALQRKVWGEDCPPDQDRRRVRRQRLSALAVTGLGGQLVLTAIGIVMFSTPASAHTSTIDISCTQVQFVYQNFPDVDATAHETIVVNGVRIASRDIAFRGPGTTDTIAITLGPGSNTIEAADSWSYRHHERGSAYGVETLSSCHPTSTTTTSSTVPVTSTSTTPSSTTTSSTVPNTSTSTSPSSTTSSTSPNTSTSSMPSSTTSSSSAPSSSTTTVPATSTTFHELGSTTTMATTSTSVHELGSTTTTTIAHGRLPFTGSSGIPFATAFGAIGLGVLAVGLGRLRRAA